MPTLQQKLLFVHLVCVTYRNIVCRFQLKVYLYHYVYVILGLSRLKSCLRKIAYPCSPVSMKLAGDYVQLALCLMKIDSGKLLSIEILIQHPEDFLTKIS